LLDWSVIPERDESHPWPGTPPHPQRAYVKALLVKINEHLEYTTRLRRFLVKHPALVLSLGFRPVEDTTQPFGFAVEQTVPCDRHLRRKLQTFDNTWLQHLLAGTVTTLKDEIPDAGDSVAMDVKHIYAWVRENNLREHIPHRFDPARQPHGDPNCKLGVKESHNQGHAVAPAPAPAPEVTVSSPPAHPSPAADQKEYLGGYGTGLSVSRHPIQGEWVIAEETRTFDQHDSRYFFSLMAQTETRIGHGPKRFTADAAFDAWYIYEHIHNTGGKAYIAFNSHGFAYPTFGPNGHPLCADGREMIGQYQYYDATRGYHAEVNKCPVLCGAGASTETCRVQHPQFVKGIGCVKYRNLELGAQLRIQLDRQSDEYDLAFDDRTAAERINSQAKALGIERPRLRRMSGICNQNTLVYIVINLKAIQRVRTAKAQARSP
jgi:hypothetical protein